MQIKLTKVKEVKDPRHPNNIPEGKVHTGEFIAKPEVDQVFWCGNNCRTSRVVEVIDDNTFRTLNSIYKWEYVDD